MRDKTYRSKDSFIDPEILGKIMVMQAALHAVPTSEGLVEFLCRGLEIVPGARLIAVQIAPHLKVFGKPHNQEVFNNLFCTLCDREIAEQKMEGFSTPGKSHKKYFCIRIQTQQARYGCLSFKMSNNKKFEPYQPFLENLANTVALTLEVRSHESNLKRVNEELLHVQVGLESLVQERTKELTNKNIELEHWAHIFKDAQWGIAVISAKGQIFELMNPAFAQLHGATVDELIGRSLLTVFPLESWNDVTAIFELIQEKGHYTWESAHLRKDGSRFPVLMDITAVRDAQQNILYHVINVQDITERKRVEEELLKFKLGIERSADAIFITEPQGSITYANPSFERIYGYSQLDAIGHTPRILKSGITPTKQYELFWKTLLEKGVVSEEIINKTKDGRFITIDGSNSPILDGAGNIIGFLGLHRDVTERKQREKELNAIAILGAALRIAPTRAEMLPIIIKQLIGLLECETASIEIIDPLTGDAVTEAALGVWELLVGTCQKSGTGLNAVISQTRQPYFTNDLKNDPKFIHLELTGDINSGIGAPLIAQDRPIGFVWAGRKESVSESEARLLMAIADIAANAIHRATLHEQTEKNAAELALAYDTTLEGWAYALELRDQETEGHTRRVVQTTLELARAIGIDQDQLENIRRGALLHDIGKMGVPDSILLKPGALTEHEWELMRNHPVHAHEMLSRIQYLQPALDIPYCHHEKWDGTGYPRGLKGDAIPLAARLFAIVDVWDAVQSERPYKKGWSREEAVAYMQEQAGKYFDPEIVSVFLQMINEGKI